MLIKVPTLMTTARSVLDKSVKFEKLPIICTFWANWPNLYLSNFPRYTVDMSTYIIKLLIAEPLGEVSNCSARSRNAFV